MTEHRSGRRLRIAGAAALLAVLTGCGAAGPSEGPPAGAPTGPPASETGAPVEPTASAPATQGQEQPAESAAAVAAMPASTPVRIEIPALERTSELMHTGMRADGTLEVPPGAEGSPASWYDGSPTPGEAGASIILGHVDSLSDDSGVFHGLDTLEPGDEIRVVRDDGTTAVFVVDRLASFAKDEFPTREVYYPVQAPELRLITCDDLDAGDGTFPNNTVVFASLVGTA